MKSQIFRLPNKPVHRIAIPLRSCVMMKGDAFLAVSKMREGPSVSVTRDRDQTALGNIGDVQ